MMPERPAPSQDRAAVEDVALTVPPPVVPLKMRAARLGAVVADENLLAQRPDQRAVLLTNAPRPVAEVAERQRLELRTEIRPLALDKKRSWQEKSQVEKQAGEELFRLAPDASPDVREFSVTEQGKSFWNGDVPLPGYEVFAKKAIAKVFSEPDYSLEDLTPQRLRVCWRLVREMCRLKGLCQPDESLAEALMPWETNPDPWIQPEKWYKPAVVATFGQISWEATEIIQRAEALAPEYCYCKHNPEYGVTSIEVPEWITYPGLAVLPPSVPRMWWDVDGSVLSDYDPEHDPALSIYIDLIRCIANNLGIWNGCKRDPDEGRYGMEGLLDPELIRLAFPSRLQLVSWEMLLVEETLAKIIERGVPGTMSWLKETYGLTKAEGLGLVRMARVQAASHTEGNIEEDRSIMLLRLEDYIYRARESLDLASEMKALKQMAIVLGLARTEPEDMLKDFVDMVRIVSAERERGRLEGAQTPSLPSGLGSSPGVRQVANEAL